MVLFLCQNTNFINGFFKLVISMKLSLNGICPVSICSLIDELGVCKCPFGTIIRNSGKRPSFKIDCGSNSWIIAGSVSEMALVNAPVSVRPSMVNSPKAVGKNSNHFFQRQFCRQWLDFLFSARKYFKLWDDFRVNDRVLTFLESRSWFELW